MATFKYISARGDIMPLTGNPFFDLVGIDGQTASTAALSSSVIGGIDGDTVNNVQAQPRPLVLALRVKLGVNVEEAKRHVLQYVKIKQQGHVEWTQSGRTVTISGVVEIIDMPRWSSGVLMQITLHCAQPFWEDIDYIVQEISEAISLHYFTDGDGTEMLYFPEEGIPFGEYDTTRTKTFTNDGDVSVGMDISIVAIDTVTNPIIYAEGGDYFGIGYGDGTKQLVMESGDTITITTHKGNKTVTLNGVNVFGKIKPGSTWLQLAAGANLFSINSDDESTTNMFFNLTYKQRYV